MATSGAVKCVWNVIPVDMYLVLGAFYFSLRHAQVPVL